MFMWHVAPTQSTAKCKGELWLPLYPDTKAVFVVVFGRQVQVQDGIV